MHRSRTRVSVEVVSAEVYERGAGPTLTLPTMVPPNEPKGWVIKSKIFTQTRVKYTVMSERNIHEPPKKIDIAQILDYVSQKQFEDFEFECKKAEDIDKWERDETILKSAESIKRKRYNIANTAAGVNQLQSDQNSQGNPWTQMPTDSTLEPPPISQILGNRLDSDEEAESTESGDGDSITTIILQMIPSPRKRRTSTPSTERGIKRQTLTQTPNSGLRTSISKSATKFSLQPSLSQPSLVQPLRMHSSFDIINESDISEDVLPATCDRRSSCSLSMSPTQSRPIRRLSVASRNSSTPSSNRITRLQSVDRSPFREKTDILEKDDFVAFVDVEEQWQKEINWSVIPGSVPRRKSEKNYVKASSPFRLIDEDGDGAREVEKDALEGDLSKDEVKTSRNKAAEVPSSSKSVKVNQQPDDLEPEYDIKAILNHRSVGKPGRSKLEYLIDWKCDWDGQWVPSWEQEANISEDALTAYKQQLERAKVSKAKVRGVQANKKNNIKAKASKLKPSRRIGFTPEPKKQYDIKGKGRAPLDYGNDDDVSEGRLTPSQQLHREASAGTSYDTLERTTPSDDDKRVNMYNDGLMDLQPMVIEAKSPMQLR